MNLRNKLLEASRLHYESHIHKHIMNVEVILANPTGIPDHSDVMDAIEKEVAIIDEYDSKLHVLQKYFTEAAPVPVAAPVAPAPVAPTPAPAVERPFTV